MNFELEHEHCKPDVGKPSPEDEYDVEAGLRELRRRLGFDKPANGIPQAAQWSSRDSVQPPVRPQVPVESGEMGWDLPEVAARIDGLIVSSLKISSAITAQVANRVGNDLNHERWAVSWVTDRYFSRRQALSAMVVDEILADPQDLDRLSQKRILRELAKEMGMTLGEVLSEHAGIRRSTWIPTVVGPDSVSLDSEMLN
ncbi:hypothetical protein ACWDYH_31510 [Nocardia goodfellowii]